MNFCTHILRTNFANLHGKRFRTDAALPQSYELAEVAVITRRSGSCIPTSASDHRQGISTGVQCLAGQHIAGVRGGKHDHFGDFIRIAWPPQRHRGVQLYEVFLGGNGLPPHRGLHRASRDCHHDAVFRFFKREHLAELDDRGLRGALQRQTP